MTSPYLSKTGPPELPGLTDARKLEKVLTHSMIFCAQHPVLTAFFTTPSPHPGCR